jgi:hypothetical protein
MTARTVTDVLDELRRLVHEQQLGVVQICGTLSGWRTHRYGTITAELTGSHDGHGGRLRITARPASATAAVGELRDAGRSETDPGDVIVHGHLTIDSRWGLQVVLLRLQCTSAAKQESVPPRRGPNADRKWPQHIRVVGLVSPSGGDDARDDVFTHLAATSLTVIEHRAPVTGPAADRAISQALDRLAIAAPIDVTLVVRGGGPAIDFTPFNSPIVVAAIDRHPRPVVTGLGHASNHTAADDAAHTAAITPTAAAQLLLTASGSETPPSPPSGSQQDRTPAAGVRCVGGHPERKSLSAAMTGVRAGRRVSTKSQNAESERHHAVGDRYAPVAITADLARQAR